MPPVTTDRDALLATIAANPADDVARLVFADWLDEFVPPDWGEFIRLVASPTAGQFLSGGPPHSAMCAAVTSTSIGSVTCSRPPPRSSTQRI